MLTICTGYEMTGHSRDEKEHYPMSILNCIETQDREAFKAEWQKLAVTKEEVSMEYVSLLFSFHWKY